MFNKILITILSFLLISNNNVFGLAPKHRQFVFPGKFLLHVGKPKQNPQDPPHIWMEFYNTQERNEFLAAFPFFEAIKHPMNPKQQQDFNNNALLPLNTDKNSLKAHAYSPQQGIVALHFGNAVIPQEIGYFQNMLEEHLAPLRALLAALEQPSDISLSNAQDTLLVLRTTVPIPWTTPTATLTLTNDQNSSTQTWILPISAINTFMKTNKSLIDTGCLKFYSGEVPITMPGILPNTTLKAVVISNKPNTQIDFFA